MKIANKLGLTYFATSLILMITAASLYYYMTKSSLEGVMQNYLYTLIHLRTAYVEMYIKDHCDIIKQFSASVVINNLLTADKADADYEQRLADVILRIKNTENSTQRIDTFFVLDKKGVIAASGIESEIGLDWSNQPYFLGAKKSISTDAVYVLKRDNAASLYFSSPVVDNSTREFLGAVVIWVDFDELNEIIASRIGLGKTGRVYLIDERGNILTKLYSTKEEPVVNLRVDSEHIRKVLEAVGEIDVNKDVIHTDYRRGKVLGVYDYVKSLRLIAIAEMDKEEAMQPMANLRYLILFIIVVVPILAWMAGIIIWKIISRSLYNLKKGIEIIGSGNLDYKINKISNDEFGMLAELINSMCVTLKQRTSSIGVLHKEIESRRKAEAVLRKSQQQLIQSEKLEAIGRIATGIAHEVKNPLGIVLQGINYLETDLPLEQKSNHDMLSMMKHNIKRADNIVRRLLDFSRVSGMDMKLEDINSVIGKALLLVQYDINLKNIEVIKNLTKDTPDINIDANKIEQVFVNIFLNAIYAMREGGKLRIRSYMMQADKIMDKLDFGIMNIHILADKGRIIVIEIEDTGTGIYQKDINNIFEPFFTTKSRGEGTGLGLAVAKSIIDMHEGIIHIKSEKGKGTVAYVLFNPSGGKWYELNKSVDDR